MRNDIDGQLISIIIPVYNSYELMYNCLNSLENQTNKNFEVIFVDDFSMDESYSKLKNALKKVTFKYQLLRNDKNSGPGVTRNSGIENSNGTYITFIDSDDYVSYDFIEVLNNIICEYGPDAIIFDFSLNGNRRHSLPLKEKKISTIDATALCNGMCWGKVFKKSIIEDNNVKFPDLIRSEDLAFSKVCISKCTEIYYEMKVLYYYTLNDDSIMHSKDTMDINNNIKAFEFIEKNIQNNAALERIFIREYLYLIVQIMIIKGYKNSDIKKFIDESNNKYKNWTKNKYIKYQPLYVRVILFFIKFKIIFPIRVIFKLKRR